MHDSGAPPQFHVNRPGKRHALALALLACLCSTGAQAQLFGPGTATTATQLKWVSNEPGHQLITPYFSTQGDNNTLLSYVNTDRVNGKLLKLRFRGAANGDALLDLSVLLAPGDVWTASLSQGPDGLARISSPDKSCTLPSLPAQGVSFDTARVQADLSATAKALHTREGLVEAINMADVPPGSALFAAMLAVRNAAPCTAAALAPLTQVGAIDSEAMAQAAGLAPPSGGLTGAWQIIRLSNYASYSGRQDAVAALDAQGKRAVANWAFAPQVAQSAGDSGKAHTTDPLLVAKGLQWTDLPDLSTPMFGTSAADHLQALDGAGRVDAVMNEFVATADDAPVPAATDWVLSQPLRRYIVAWDEKTQQRLFAPGFEDRNLTTVVTNHANLGHLVCSRARHVPLTREAQREDSLDFGVQPPKPSDVLCGSVAVMHHVAANSQVLQSQFARPVSPKLNGQAMKAGWAQYSLNPPAGGPGLTMLGYAATSLRNKDQNGNYGSVVPHVRLRD